MNELSDACRTAQAEVDAAHRKFLDALEDAGMLGQAVEAIHAVMECTPTEAAEILEQWREGRLG